MGKRIRIVNRSGKSDAQLTPEGVEVCAADLYNPSAAAAMTLGAVTAYQCAQPAYHRWAQEFPPLQTSIIDGVGQSGVKLVLGDNLYMYGKMNGQPMREDTLHNPVAKKSKIRAQMADAAMAAHQSGKIRIAIARGADFYGAGVLGSAFGERTFPAILAGKAGEMTGNGDTPHTVTYIDDFGKAMANIGNADHAMGQVWHVPNAPTITQRQFLTLAFELAGTPAKFTTIGPLMMRLAGLFIPAAREVVEMMYEFTEPFIVDHSKYTKTFGDHSTPFRDGIQATLNWYKTKSTTH
jgi:nucleoside-diphosphate-sugar epimerase